MIDITETKKLGGVKCVERKHSYTYTKKNLIQLGLQCKEPNQNLYCENFEQKKWFDNLVRELQLSISQTDFESEEVWKRFESLGEFVSKDLLAETETKNLQGGIPNVKRSIPKPKQEK